MSKTELTDEQLISEYITDMEFRELSPVTIEKQSSNLRKFAKEVRLRDDDVIALRSDLKRWLMRKSLQPQTRVVLLTQLHCMYKWANAEGHFRRVEAPNGALVDFDPTIGITRPKTKKGVPHPIPEDELSLALDGADPLMRCWLLIGAMCGARCKEIAGIRREDIQPEIETLHLEYTKGQKPRDVDLPYEVLEALEEYGMRESGPLWDVTPQDVSKKVIKYLRSLGIKSSAHKLRHRAATRFYRATDGDSFLTADFLGHSDPATSRIYAAPDRKKAAMARESLRVTKVTPAE